MGQIKELNIKNRTYCFFDDMIDIKNVCSDLLKTDKKSHKDVDIYYIGYITIKKFSECENIGYITIKKFSNYENIHSVNPLYLIIHSATGHFKEKNYVIIDSTEKCEEVFSGIKSKIEMINSGKEMFYGKNYAKIGANTEDDLPLNKQLKFPTLIIIIRCVLQKGKKLYPQIYLDDCLYES